MNYVDLTEVEQAALDAQNLLTTVKFRSGAIDLIAGKGMVCSITTMVVFIMDVMGKTKF